MSPDTRPPQNCHYSKYGRSKSNGWCVITEIFRKSHTLRFPPFKLRSLKVIGIDRIDRIPMTS